MCVRHHDIINIVFIGMVFFSAARNYQQASMMSLRLERSKLALNLEFLVEFDNEFG
jgi:hypothetical protein